MSDADSLLRERLEAAAAFELEADPKAVRDGIDARRRRIRRRRRGAAVVGLLAVAVVAAGVVRLVDDQADEEPEVQASGPEAEPDAPPPGTEAPATVATSPYFEPADGWYTAQAEGVATAADIPLGPESQAGGVPFDTVEQLLPGDVVLFAMVVPAADVGDGSTFPERGLPLSLDDAQPGGLEGQPEGVYAERLAAQVKGWNVDLVAFFGGESAPHADTWGAAQEQLDKLVVPALQEEAPQPPEATAAGPACLPSDLVAQVVLDANLTGHITVRNVSQSACALSNAAKVEPRDTNSTVIPATATTAEPAWAQAGDAAPAGWPAVTVAPGAEAQAVLSLSNWCGGVFQNQLYFVITLPGQTERIGGAAPSVQAAPQCRDPQALLQLTVGPFEPPR